MKSIILAALLFSSNLVYGMGNPAAVMCADFSGVYDNDSLCTVGVESLVNGFNKLTGENIKDGVELCEESLDGLFDSSNDTCIVEAWPFLSTMKEISGNDDLGWRKQLND